MSYTLYAHPFSSYCWKALIALHEKGVPFAVKIVEEAATMSALRRLWPLGKFPVLVADGEPVIESTTIIEFLDLRHPNQAPMLPADATAALDVRFMDRIFDNHVMTPMNAIVRAHMQAPGAPDANIVTKAQADLDTIYAWLEERLADQEWASGPSFSLADCAAAPSLFYADWVREIPESHVNLRAYRARLNARPSVSRCIEGARPYRSYFPPGAPERD